MNLTAVNRTLALLGGMFDPNRLTEPFLPQMSGKPVFQAGNHTLPRISPESVGVSSEHIAAFLHRLRENPQFRMHSVMILRHGNVICEADFGGQDHRYPRYTFSACKSNDTVVYFINKLYKLSIVTFMWIGSIKTINI